MPSALRGGALALLLTMLACSQGCGDEVGCDLEAYTRDRGGFGLIDCGIAGENTASVDACAVMARGDGSTFRAVYELEDGSFEALVRSSEGYVLVRAPADGTGLEEQACEAGAFTKEDGRTYVSCREPGMPVSVCE